VSLFSTACPASLTRNPRNPCPCPDSLRLLPRSSATPVTECEGTAPSPAAGVASIRDSPLALRTDYLETGLAGLAVENWFQGVEAFGNRVVFDGVHVISGFYVSVFAPGLIQPARYTGWAWLAMHILVFPHSMVIQYWIDNENQASWHPPVCESP
jgi:hypothetical protein